MFDAECYSSGSSAISDILQMHYVDPLKNMTNRFNHQEHSHGFNEPHPAISWLSAENLYEYQYQCRRSEPASVSQTRLGPEDSCDQGDSQPKPIYAMLGCCQPMDLAIHRALDQV